MDKFQQERISKLSKKELELELLKIQHYGNPLDLDKQYILKQLKGRRGKEKQKLKEQKELIKKVPDRLIKGNIFLRKCKEQVENKKPLTDNVFKLFKEAIGKK